ncbi:MAG TPA: STAS domain-containing protein [Acidimicrobiia bacterium]|nr:STAS domain-containing protein [Acidimicrobiia bacterium]
MQTNLEIRADGATLLIIAGEIDVSVAHDLAAAIDKACDAAAELTIDLADVSFCDSSGIAQFVRAARICENGGGVCRITGATSGVRRTFEACGLLDMLDA